MSIQDLAQISNQNSDQFFLIAGPCAIEDEQLALEIAQEVKQITNRLGIPYIFKASYKKANRSRLDSFTGIGDLKALQVLEKVKSTVQLPVTSDVHTVEEAVMAAEYVDVLQIPAFLCRQTELLLAAGKTGRMITIKKGQFMAPEAMRFAIDKVRSTGNEKIALIERGTTFGYQDLVVDFRAIPAMRALGKDVILDCTHSLQRPNQGSGVTGGQPALIETIAKAGIAVGADGLFIETHPDPSQAKSDGANMLPLSQLEGILQKLCKIRESIL